MFGRVSSYVVSALDEDTIDESQAALEGSLYAYFESDDIYTVTSMSEMVETMTSMINIIVGVLAGIAAISLVVGGIVILFGDLPAKKAARHGRKRLQPRRLPTQARAVITFPKNNAEAAPVLRAASVSFFLT